MTAATHRKCDRCPELLTISDAVVLVAAGVTFVLCLDCTLSQLPDDDSVSVSVDLLRRLRDGEL